MNKIKVVAYYTLNTPYEEEVKNLRTSLDELNLDHDIVGIKDLGSWQMNTRAKALFMKEMLEKHSNFSLLYVDADAIVRREPEFLYDIDCDIALRYQDFSWKKNESLSGTIYMANNNKTRQLCDLWDKLNKKYARKGRHLEQWNLGKAIEEMQDLKIINLPPEYTFIFDIMRRIYPDTKPVIEHFQASRRFRNK